MAKTKKNKREGQCPSLALCRLLKIEQVVNEIDTTDHHIGCGAAQGPLSVEDVGQQISNSKQMATYRHELYSQRTVSAVVVVSDGVCRVQLPSPAWIRKTRTLTVRSLRCRSCGVRDAKS